MSDSFGMRLKCEIRSGVPGYMEKKICGIEYLFVFHFVIMVNST